MRWRSSQCGPPVGDQRAQPVAQGEKAQYPGYPEGEFLALIVWSGKLSNKNKL